MSEGLSCAVFGIVYSSIINILATKHFWCVTACFHNKRNLGVVYDKYFNPFPVTGLAFILTVVGCCINEWASGTWTEVSLTKEEYKEVYEKHLANLLKFDEHTRTHGVLPAMLQCLHDNGR
ncbi:hypothetical protein BV22DRAFT_1076729 [Leucogyrophana mollusca]|uniref:Uncharacterized protein n=1 Tax=Leucogyrophana mollusca TaxID=85980 RepID=A0ACB8AWX1_9AGAM|nr:hypothetical protein BV22DRAFT_1076729 [Leucogyrophana mollusca]